MSSISQFNKENKKALGLKGWLFIFAALIGTEFAMRGIEFIGINLLPEHRVAEMKQSQAYKAREGVNSVLLYWITMPFTSTSDEKEKD